MSEKKRRGGKRGQGAGDRGLGVGEEGRQVEGGRERERVLKVGRNFDYI
jgi:hypothetical protein